MLEFVNNGTAKKKSQLYQGNIQNSLLEEKTDNGMANNRK